MKLIVSGQRDSILDRQLTCSGISLDDTRPHHQYIKEYSLKLAIRIKERFSDEKSIANKVTETSKGNYWFDTLKNLHYM